MYMYRAAVHSLDAEFIFLEMATSNAFLSHELDLTHAFILPMYLISAGGELCLGLEFRTR